MLDTLHAVQTPEGVDLSLRVAGPVPRAYAWLADSFLRAFALMLAMLVMALFGLMGLGLNFVLAFVAWWFYHVAFEVLGAGQTPGKRLLGLQVVCADGTPVGWNASVLRNLLRVVDFLPLLNALGLASMLVDRSFRRLGDLAAGTVVVYRDAEAPASVALPDIAPLAPPVPLTLEEQSAVIAFAERAPRLTPERAAELGAVASPLAGAASDTRGQLVRMAAWLVGGGEP